MQPCFLGGIVQFQLFFDQRIVNMGEGNMLGNGVVGILAETTNKWERRAPLTPSHCARLLHHGSGVDRIIVQPSTKRIYHDALYEDVGCEVSDDLSECGLIIAVKQPKLEMILPDRAYAFFSHTHKAQKENMPLLDKILAERATLFDYELIVGDHGKRLIAFGKFAGRAGTIDFLHCLGKRYLSLGYSTPFLSLGTSYMYPSLASAKSAVISVGEEIATLGLPSGLCPLVFVFTGTGNVSQGAQEIFKLLPHTYVDPDELPELLRVSQPSRVKRSFQVYGCVVTSQHMVNPKGPSKSYDKADYYSHPEHYIACFHEKIAPYASVIVNCMYWEPRFPRLLTTKQLQDLMRTGRSSLIGITDITCDIGGSIEFINQTTSIDSPIFRYDPFNDSYHHDGEGNGIICSSVDILPTEFAKEASQHFGDVLSRFLVHLVSTKDVTKLPAHLRRACIVHKGSLTSLFEYIPRMREKSSESHPSYHSNKRHTVLVSLSGHLFDQFLINEALDIIEAAGGAFHLVKCHVGQTSTDLSFSELEVGADDDAVLDQIIDSLTSLATGNDGDMNKDANMISLQLGRVPEIGLESGNEAGMKSAVLILGAGRVCRPAVEILASSGDISSSQWSHSCTQVNFGELTTCEVIVASLFLKDAEEVVQGIPNAKAIQLDVSDDSALHKYVSQVDVVISLLPASCHLSIANACIKLKRHLVTASYVNDSMSKLCENAKDAGITILDHMMAMKMINEAHQQGGKIRSFTSYCGGLPSPAAANNPLGYKFSWNPAGAIKAGRNSAVYKSHGEIIHVSGDSLYDSAEKFRLPELPALALECLPNRDSLVYGDVYGIRDEAITIFRGTLRYEGFSEIMGTLARIGLLNLDPHPDLENEEKPSFEGFTLKLLGLQDGAGEKEVVQRINAAGHSKLDEADMVLLHHEIEVEFTGEEYSTEKRQATLLEFGKSSCKEGGTTTTTTAMALTVGVPAAIGALLLLTNKLKTRGLLRPIDPEVYVPALHILNAYGIKCLDKDE
ncbi:hypothetical protein V2J09_016655 [Rumex salicifolius]